MISRKSLIFFIKLYADDTFLCLQNENMNLLEKKVNIEIEKVFHWLEANHLTLNIGKSKFMIITKKKNIPPFSIQINGKDLDMCSSYKYLGIFLDKDLSWKFHVDHVCKKIAKAYGFLTKLRNCVEIDTLREVYHALIHSYLRYGIIAWGNTTKANMKQLQTLVNRAIRVMSFAPYTRIDLDPLYEILEILKVEQIYKLEIAKFSYRRENNLLPTEIANYFQLRNIRPNLRNNRSLRSERVIFNTTSGKNSVLKKSFEIWENLPEEIKSIPTLKSFKRLFKSHLILVNE